MGKYVNDIIAETTDALQQANGIIEIQEALLQIEKDHCAQMERERDAAVKDLRKSRLPCSVCAHSIRYTGIPCGDRPDRPADGSCDFVWRGIQGEGKER
jgi:hypothetical protein